MNRPQRKGLVLFMVLVVLTIAATLLASSARRACETALQAGAAEESLQLRWGALSCEAACLPAAERLLWESAPEASRVPLVCEHELILGKMVFHLVIFDEQSKANVNAMAQRLDEQDLSRRLWSLLSGRPGAAVELRPSPLTDKSKHRPYACFEQVLRISGATDLLRPLLTDRSPVGVMTLWGSGLVNYKKAPLPVLREATAGAIDEEDLAKLDKYRSDHPDCTLIEAMSQSGISTKAAEKVRQTLTDMSLCHSLWIVAQGHTRQWYRLYVRASGFAEGGRWVLAW